MLSFILNLKKDYFYDEIMKFTICFESNMYQMFCYVHYIIHSAKVTLIRRCDDSYFTDKESKAPMN